MTLQHLDRLSCQVYIANMATDQLFEHESTDKDKDIVYFTNGLAIDDFDLAIKQMPNDNKDESHAKVELVFYQDKGNRRREVVAAVHMQLSELMALASLIDQKKKALLEKDAES